MNDSTPYEVRISLLDEKNNQYPIIFDKIKPNYKDQTTVLEGKKLFIQKTDSYITPKILENIYYKQKNNDNKT